MQNPPRVEGGRRKDIAENCVQITHDDDNGVIFVLQNSSAKEFAVKYDFSGSSNLALEASSSAKQIGELQVQCTVPPNQAINLCHLKVKDDKQGYELRSKMATMVNDSTGFKSSDSQGDETRKAITDGLFILSRRTGDGYQFFLQCVDEKADFNVTIDFSNSQNFALTPASGFSVTADAPLKISGIVPFKTDRLELGSLQLVDKAATGAKMMYNVRASKSTSRWEKLQQEATEKAKKDAEAEAARKKAEEDERKRKAAEEEAARKAQEEADRKKAEEAERKRKEAEEKARAEAEADRKKKEAEDAARRAKEEADRKKKEAEEAARRAKEEADRKKAEEEAERKRKAAEEEAERKRKAAEEEAERKRKEAEEKARLEAEAAAKKKAAEDAARADAERKAAERAARRKLQGRTQPDCVKNRMLATDLGMDATTCLGGIRRDFGPVNWALFSYQTEPLQLIEGGSQGLFELFDFLADDLAAVAIVRMAFGAGAFRRMKYIAIQWMGDDVKPMARAKVQQIHEKMVNLIGPAHMSLTLMGAGERNAQTVIKKVEKVFVVDGSSQAGGAVTESDYINAIKEEQAATAEFYNEASGFGMVKK